MLGWSTGIACFAPGVVLKSSVEVVAIAGQLIAKTKSSDNRPEDFNTARSGRERYPNQPRKKTSGSANLPKWKDVLSGRGRELQSVLLRDWYIGCAQPSQGCERGSTPLSRSSNPFCKHFRQSFNWQSTGKFGMISRHCRLPTGRFLLSAPKCPCSLLAIICGQPRSPFAKSSVDLAAWPTLRLNKQKNIWTVGGS